VDQHLDQRRQHSRATAERIRRDRRPAGTVLADKTREPADDILIAGHETTTAVLTDDHELIDNHHRIS
jgi:hypothetical protein